MYDVASRTIVTKSATGQNVGPGTYILCNPRSRKQNCAPFLSSRSKSPSFITKLNTEAIYDIRNIKDKIKGGSAPQNKAPRFVYKEEDTPGPTKYNAKPIQCKKRPKLDPTKPKLYVCRVPYSIAIIAPSIPTKINENGYDIDADGNIIKVPPDKVQSEPLNIKSKFPRDNGCRWSCRTSRRFKKDQYVTPGPGPGAYFAQVPKCRRAEEDERFREMARRFSFIPRYVEMQEMKAAREGKPGPGDYDIDSTSPYTSTSINPRPFISSSSRFKILNRDTPGPTNYDICYCFTKKKQFSIKCAPFGFESPRFRTKKINPNAPSPASYNIKGPLQAKIESKKNPFAVCEVPFNKSSERDVSSVKRDAPCTPSPADYPEDKSKAEDCKCVDSWVFKSCVQRFYSPADKKDFQDPTKYNVARSFVRSRNQKSFYVGETAFRSSGPRSTTPAVKTGVPCPTTYDLKYCSSESSYHFNVSPRFKHEEEKPGPGSYNIHPSLQVATYKAWDTHNLKLKENVLRKKLRLAPWETRKQWCHILKKKRLLKWFDVLPDFEERMCFLVQKVFEHPV